MKIVFEIEIPESEDVADDLFYAYENKIVEAIMNITRRNVDTWTIKAKKPLADKPFDIVFRKHICGSDFKTEFPAIAIDLPIL